MTVLVHWLMLVLFVGWGAFFIFVLFRFRKGANPKAELRRRQGQDREGPRDRHRRRRDGPARRSTPFRPGPRACATFRPRTRRSSFASSAKQFAWNVALSRAPTAGSAARDVKLRGRRATRSVSTAPIPTAKDDIATINQLNLPVDRPVLVHLSSKDVIHSFGLFEMRVKQDAVPGLDIPVWFIPNRIGDYEIACSQLCGLGHFRMRGFLNIKCAADYQNFLAEEAKLLAQ